MKLGFNSAWPVALIAVSLTACTKATESEEKAEPTMVKTAPAEEGPITEWLELQGRVAPPYDRDAMLAPLVPGRLVFLAARVGDVVASGQVLARVETGALDDEVKAAEAAVTRSDADLVFKRGVAKRSRDLVAKGVAAREEAEEKDAAATAAESTLAQDHSTLATAKRRRSWSELTAPFHGVVIRVDRRLGDFVDGTGATPVLEFASTDGWEIVASGTAAVLQRLRPGQSAMIGGLDAGTSAASHSGADEGAAKPLAATVATIARAVDPTTGAGDVRLRPASRPSNMALGAPVQVRIAVQSRAKVILVPAAAIRLAADGSSEVVVFEGGVAHIRKVDTGLTETGRTEITAGLAIGTRVVIEDPIGIAEGAALTEEAEAAEPAEQEPKKAEAKSSDAAPAASAKVK